MRVKAHARRGAEGVVVVDRQPQPASRAVGAVRRGGDERIIVGAEVSAVIVGPTGGVIGNPIGRSIEQIPTIAGRCGIEILQENSLIGLREHHAQAGNRTGDGRRRVGDCHRINTRLTRLHIGQ